MVACQGLFLRFLWKISPCRTERCAHLNTALCLGFPGRRNTRCSVYFLGSGELCFQIILGFPTLSVWCVPWQQVVLQSRPCSTSLPTKSHDSVQLVIICSHAAPRMQSRFVVTSVEHRRR